MKRKIYEPPTLDLLVLGLQFVRTSFEKDAEIDGDEVYGDDGWTEE